MELRMSQKERDKLKVLEQLKHGAITQRQAAERLGLCVRQVRRLLAGYLVQGDRAVVHKGRGKPSNRRTPPALEQRAKAALDGRYRDFGPTLAAEKLAEHEGIVLSRETVRKLMQQEHLWGGQRKPRPHRRRRPRRACFGELVQMDSSTHAWFEQRAPGCTLVTMIDDATGRKLLRFYASDTTQANMAQMCHWLELYGRPLAFYTDWATHFRQLSVAGHKAAQTQIERALGELDIRLICAHSPQAKGRVERSHGTDQDRLIKELRLAGISDIERANQFLERVYLPRINEKFAVVPADPADAHRELESFDLAAIFSVQHTRRLANDWTIQFQSASWQILPGQRRGLPPKSEVTIEERLDGTLRVRHGDRYVRFEEAPSKGQQALAAALAGEGESSGLRPSSTPSPAKPTPKGKYIPPPTHPWR